jgi:hypothetical protein
MSNALGSFFTSWEDTEISYLEQIFSGSNDSVISDLWSLMQDGMMITISPDIDLSIMTTNAQKIMYGQMIPIAWALAPGNVNPFIL